MNETRELRFAVSPLEERASDSGSVVMRGYAYRFNELSQDLGGFRERIMPGAGGPSLRKNDVLATFNHNATALLGRVSSGTLRVGEDREGGWYEIDLPDTTVGRDVAELLKRKDLRGSSFAFSVLPGGQHRAAEDDEESGLPIREVSAMDVRELGPVTNPAYVTATAQLRSIEEALAIGEFAPDEKPDETPEPVDHTRTYPALVRATMKGTI